MGEQIEARAAPGGGAGPDTASRPAGIAPGAGEAGAEPRPRGRLAGLMRDPARRSELKRRVTETGESYESLAEWLGVSPRGVQSHAKRQGWARPPAAADGGAAPPTADQNAQLIRARLLATIVRQVETVDARLRAAGAEADEKDARILAHLARTLGMVIDMGSGGTTSNHASPPAVETTSIDDSLNALRDGLGESRDIDGSILRFLSGIPDDEQERLWKAWRMDARPGDQKPPEGDWLTWLLLGGRGAGKTRSGAEFVRGMATGRRPFAAGPTGPIALVGETYADVREVMIEGASGLLTIHETYVRPLWTPSRRRLEWHSGVVAQAFSSEDPEALRGPQFAAAWADELGKWRHAEETWDMLQFGLRLGTRPRQMVTTTPRAIPLLRRLIDDPTTVVTHATTAINAHNLAATFLSRVVARYEGTRLGRQELGGELIEDRSDALFRRDEIEAGRSAAPPQLRRIVVAVDPPASARSGTCGIVAAGVAANGIGYVLADRSIREVRPSAWAAEALGAYRLLGADALVAEVNQGGDMVEAVLHEVDAGVPVTKVRATRGKWLRAEPVAALYAQGRIRHAGIFQALEDEMCDFGPDGLSSGRSPDRLDALVWAITALMLGDGGEPRVRGM